MGYTKHSGYKYKSIFLLSFFFFLVTPTIDGNSQAGDRTCTTTATRAAAVTMLDPELAVPQGNSKNIFLTHLSYFIYLFI